VGLRLLDGHVGFRTALFVLVLAPEAYLPLRMVGTHYHASAEGMRAAEQVLTVLDQPSPRRGAIGRVPDPERTGIEVDRLVVQYSGRTTRALDGVSVAIGPGEIVAVTGPSGCGKSTLLAAVLGFVAPDAGVIRVGGFDIAELDPDAWRARIAWAPQR